MNSKQRRELRIAGQSEMADRLDEAEKLRAGVRPPSHRSYIDRLLDDAREDDERERRKADAAAIERQYQHIMNNGGKALRARQHALWDSHGKPTPAAVRPARALSTKPDRPYFAYGMNMNVAEMRNRCPDAKPVGAYVLEGFKLVFRTYADIQRAKGARVAGVIWMISEKCERALDRLEGYPRSYLKGYFNAPVRGKQRRVMYYFMPASGRFTNPPPENYLRCILEGCASFDIVSAPVVAAARAALDAMTDRVRKAPPQNEAPLTGDDDQPEWF